MKYLLLIFFPIFSFGQEKFKVEYEVRKFMNFGKTEQDLETEKRYSRPLYIELTGDNNRCSQKQIVKLDNSQGATSNLNYIGGYKDLESYYDFDKNYLKVSREMDNKLYLIKVDFTKINWNLTRETKVIKGFNVKKAIYEEGDLLLEAWYATEIKSKCGPDNYNNLPGLILEMRKSFKTVPDQYMTYKLESIQLDISLKFTEPNKGKLINQEEFKKLESEYKKRVQMMVDTENSSGGVEKD